jgi:transcriptional regulator with XRE-family HTH domain
VTIPGGRDERHQRDAARREVIATRIREARRLAGLSQGQVAQLLGLHRPAVSEIEAGNRRVTAEEISWLAELFDVSASWLVGEGVETVGVNETRVQLAARELSKLKPDDLNRLLAVLASMRDDTGDPPSSDASAPPRENDE